MQATQPEQATFLPNHQRVVFHQKPGPSSVIQQANLPLPQRPPHHLLIRVHACSINPKDWKGRKASGNEKIKTCLGEDVSGVVVQCDSQGSNFQVGDRVFCMMNMLEWRGNTRFFRHESSYIPFSRSRPTENTKEHGQIRWGASSEYTVVDERFCAHLPATVSFIDGASVCLASLTALQNLKKAGFSMTSNQSMKDKHVLVHAGAGGVGSWCIQLAKWAGAYVSTTCSERNFNYVQSLGCDRPIDYNTERFDEITNWDKHSGTQPPPNVIVDLIGGDYELRSLGMLSRFDNGMYLHVLNSGWQTYFQRSQYRAVYPFVWIGMILLGTSLDLLQLHPSGEYRFTIVKPSSTDLTFIGKLLESGECRAVIDRVLPFNAESVRNGHDLSENGHCKGKIVLDMMANSKRRQEEEERVQQGVVYAEGKEQHCCSTSSTSRL
jgi:alcohol dehydrogenase